MKKVLFMIPTLGHGGAEKVLVNLVNNMDQERFQITVMSLYDEGINRQFLAEGIIYKCCFKKSFPGVSHILKLANPKQLFRMLVKDHYDYAISYLEGQTARIISGCDDTNMKKICWIHRTYTEMSDVARLFRSKKEAFQCYHNFDQLVYVSSDVKKAFEQLLELKNHGMVLYNTNQSDKILKSADEPVNDVKFSSDTINLCAMGSLIPVKGFKRLIIVHAKLKKKGYNIHTYILGEGPEKDRLLDLIKKYELEDSITLLGYQENPYKYMKRCNLFVCSSYSEGFSTAVTESLILGMPVITTSVSGMTELLGENNEYGVITSNDTKSLYRGLKSLISNSDKLEYYHKQAVFRGKTFQTEKTVDAVQKFLQNLE